MSEKRERADELEEAVGGLGETNDERLERVAGRNASLEERIPTPDEPTGDEGPAEEG